MYGVLISSCLLVLIEVCLFHDSVNTMDESFDTQQAFLEQMVNVYYNICSLSRMCNDPKQFSSTPMAKEETSYENNTPPKLPCCGACSCIKHSCLTDGTCCPEILSDEYKEANNLVNQDCVIPGLRKHFVGNGFIMVQSCPITFLNNTIRGSCQSPKKSMSLKDAAPVSHLSDDTTYSNIYCALCNNVEKAEVIPWTPTGLECYGGSLFVTSEEELIESIWDRECNVKYSAPPGVHVEECLKSYEITQCNVTGLWKDYDLFLDTACNSFTSLYKPEHYKTIYRNIFCYLCNGLVEIEKKCSTTSPNFIYTSFSAILNFAADDVESKQTDVDSSPRNCSNDFVYDIYQWKCLKIRCFFGKRFYNGSCQEGYMNDIQGPYYAVNMKITPQFMITQKKVLELGKLLPLQLSSIMIPPELFNDTDVCQDIRMFHQTDNLNGAVVHHFLYETIIGTYYGPPISMDIVENIINLDGVYKRMFIGNEWTAIYIELYTLGGHKDEARQNITEIQHEATLTACGARMAHQAVILELKKAMICPLIELNTLELPWTTTGSGILIPELDLYIEEKYLMNSTGDDTVMVCLDSYMPKATEMAILKRNQNIKSSAVALIGYITFGCVLLSVVCLGLTLLTYAIFPELRTTPGIHNIILSSALIIAQCMFQFGIGAKEDVQHWVCSVLGMLTHFTWLFVIFWMNVCSIHMARVFRNKSMDRIGKKSTFLYLLYAFSMSSVLMIINNVIDYIVSGGKSYGYGENEKCYISSRLMLGITFGLPVGALVITNLFLFIFTVCQLSSVEIVSTANQQNRNLFIIYARLSTVTGITWVFGFLYTFTGIAVFEYLFAILNAGQGVFIMLAFVFNRKVLCMYKTLCVSPKKLTVGTLSS